MKRFNFILIIFVITSGAAAQASFDTEPFQKFTPQPSFDRSLVQLYDSIYYWEWDYLNTAWQFSEKCIDFDYDANYNKLSEIRQKWDGGSWLNDTKSSCIYNATNNLISSFRYNWSGNDWVFFQQSECTYDENQNLKSWLIVEGYHSGGGCVYNYDDHDNLISQIYQTYGQETSQYVYTYNANNNMISWLYQTWIENNWWNEFSGTYQYDENNSKTGALYYEWNGTSYEISGKSSYTYDANNNLIGQSWQDWVDSIWINNYCYIYIYDPNNFKRSEVYKIWDPVAGAWMNVDSTHYYFQTVLGTDDLRALPDKIKVYPNPSSTTITIELPQTTTKKCSFLTIYNITGQNLIEKRINEPVIKIDVSALPRGVYFLRFEIENEILVKKVLVINSLRKN